jgi:type IV pilus biogenesis protein PilP
MQNNHRMALLVLSACVALPAGAQSTSQSLTRIEAETMVLKARERQLEVQSSIVGKQNEIAAKQTMTMALNKTEVVGDPMIRAIEGIGQRMYATLEMNDGSIVDVQLGDTLPGGMQIVSIGPREVVAKSGSRRKRLAFMTPGGAVPPVFSGGMGAARGAK